MIPARDLWVLTEDHLDIVDAAVAELAARNRGSRAIFATLRKGEIDETVVGETGIERHIKKTTLSLSKKRRHAFKRFRLRAVLGDDAEPPGPFGHEHAAVWQKSDAPGVIEPVRHRLDLDRALLRVDHVFIGMRELRHQHQNGACQQERGAKQANERRLHSNWFPLVRQQRPLHRRKRPKNDLAWLGSSLMSLPSMWRVRPERGRP